MNTLSKVVCKGVGITGMSAVLYDAFTVGKTNSKRTAQSLEADHFERVHAATRTTSTESHINSAMQNKIANWRMNNPLLSMFGNIKGFTGGFLNSLGDNIIPTAFASMALVGKNTVAKIGAWGVGIYGLYTVLKEGFGFTKKTPVD